MAAALPQLRRDLTPRAQVGAWFRAGQWLVSRTVGLERRQRPLRQRACCLAQLEIEFSDGYVQTVVTDESWTAGPSAVVFNDSTTVRQSMHGVTRTRGWSPVSPTRLGQACTRPNSTSARLTPYIGPPVRRQEELRPITIWTSPGR